MVRIILPWPPTDLSPNKRLHWTQVAKLKREYRKDCWVTTLEQMNRLNPKPGFKEQSLHLELTFLPPDKRHYDRDNLVARMKSGIDGMCDALNIDDSQFAMISANLASQKDLVPRTGSLVQALIYEYISPPLDAGLIYRDLV